jgi:hypothetical protein
MSRKVLLAALLAFATLSTACGGGGSSPSEPAPTLTIEALVVNADGLSTLLRLDMHYDGARVGGTGTGTAATASTPLMHMRGVSAAPGPHVVRAVVLEQTVTPSRYTLTATADRNGQRTALGSVTGTVATGGSLEIPFTL